MNQKPTTQKACRGYQLAGLRVAHIPIKNPGMHAPPAKVAMGTAKGSSFAILRLIAERTNHFSFPKLARPPVPPTSPATEELVSWGAHLYCFSWISHTRTMVSGIIILRDAGNSQSAAVLSRSVFELGAHAYYVKKHLKQHIGSKHLDAAWEFLGPIANASRYISEHHPRESALFPEAAHIRKVVNCFGEVLPGATEDYSYLSEFCHPNALAFMQHYRWPNRFEVEFVGHEAKGMFESTTAACIQGLMAVQEILRLTQEKTVLPRLLKLLSDVAGGAERSSAHRT
jgi:hypothetical protein